MGNFRSDRGSGGFRNSSPRSGERDRGGFRDRDSRNSRSSGREKPEMHSAICDKCKKECEIPFKPSGNKPVFCSDCFRKEGGSDSGSSRDNFRPRNNFSSSNNSSSTSSGISPEQFKQLNTKLDKILGILETLEIAEDEEEEDEE